MSFSADPKDPQFWAELLRDDIQEAKLYGIEVKVAEGRLIAIQRSDKTGNVISYRDVI